MLNIYFLFLFFSIFVAAMNSRVGLWLIFIAAFISDPIRKLTPNNPVYLTLTFLPIFIALYFNVTFIENKEKRIFSVYPQIKIPFFIFLFSLAFSTALPLVSNFSYLPLVLMSLLQYLGMLFSVQLGFYIGEKKDTIIGFLKMYIVIVSPFLVSAILHLLGFDIDWPVLKTMAYMDSAYYAGHAGSRIVLINGLFRNPEELGWHAMFATVSAVFLLLRGKESLLQRIFYLFISIISPICILLSGRRKFFIGLILYVIIFIFLISKKKMLNFFRFAVIFIVLFGLSKFLLSKYDISGQYFADGVSAFQDAVKRADGSTFGSIAVAFERDGLFGRGLGKTTQGISHFSEIYAIEGPILESGAGKVFSELGVLGASIFILLIFSYFYTIFKNIKYGQLKRSSVVVYLVAFVLANIANFIFSHQVFSDPLVGITTGIIMGLLLASLKYDESSEDVDYA